MADWSEWQKATKELYEKGNLSGQHGFFSQLEISALTQSPLENESEDWVRSDGQIFYNICPYQDEIFDSEFLSSPGCAAWIHDHWPDQLKSKNIFLYLIASPTVTTFKKALVLEQGCRHVNLGIDPYSLGLWKSKVFKSEVSEEIFSLGLRKETHIFRLSTQPYAMAGASDAQQLAIALASVVQLVNDYEGKQSIDEILSSTSIELSLKPHLFLGIAKVRALKVLLARLREIYQMQEASGEIPVFVTPSVRFFATREPWNNILRLTSISAAAKMSGASGFLSYPHDLFSKNPKGYRTARNVSEVLELESYLGQVSDPLLGSSALQQLESQLVEKAWELFVEIDKKDGLTHTLRSGWLLAQINCEEEQQQEVFQNSKLKITGVNDYPLVRSLSESYPLANASQVIDIESWWEQQVVDEGCDDLSDVARFVPVSLPAIYEKWQFKSDKLKSKGVSTVIPVITETAALKGKKLEQVKRNLALASLEVKVIGLEDGFDSPVVAVIASDPNGDFAKQCLEKLKQEAVGLKVWVGEKQLDGFDLSVGSSTLQEEGFEQIFKKLEGK